MKIGIIITSKGETMKISKMEIKLVNKGIEAARRKRKENNEELIPMEQVFKECGLE